MSTHELSLQWQQLEESRLLASIEEKTARKRMLLEQEDWAAQRDAEKREIAEQREALRKYRAETLSDIDAKARAATDMITQRYSEFTQYRDQALGKLKVTEDALKLAASQLALDRRALDMERDALAKDRARLANEQEDFKKERQSMVEAVTKRFAPDLKMLVDGATPLPADIFALAGLAEGNAAVREEIAVLRETKDVLEQEVVMLMEYKDDLAGGLTQPPRAANYSPMVVNTDVSRMAYEESKPGAGNSGARTGHTFTFEGESVGLPGSRSASAVGGVGGGASVEQGDSKEGDATDAAWKREGPPPPPQFETVHTGAPASVGDNTSSSGPPAPVFYPSLSNAAFSAKLGNPADITPQVSARSSLVDQIRTTVSTTDLMRATPTARAVREAVQRSAGPTVHSRRQRSGSVDTGTKIGSPPLLSPALSARNSLARSGSASAISQTSLKFKPLGAAPGSPKPALPAREKPAHSPRSGSLYSQQMQQGEGARWGGHSPTLSQQQRGRQYDRAATTAKAAMRSARSWSPHEPLQNKLRRPATPERGHGGGSRRASDGGASLGADSVAYHDLVERIRCCETPIDMLNCCDLSAVPSVRIVRTAALVCHGFLDKLTHSGIHTFYFWLLSTQLLYGYLSPAQGLCVITKAVPLARYVHGLAFLCRGSDWLVMCRVTAKWARIHWDGLPVVRPL